ncbi:WXG100 family type VII secretion target [Actinoplanes sp. HUAS TT8]|uniref:WXG100 family type VII secretion target n=1 Tax=Actinoplanes sp. HUAS TT8 TaxID=3447453 RepID=UPI003F52150F
MSGIDDTPIYVGEGLEAAGGWLNGQSHTAADELHKLRTLLAPLQDAWTKSSAAEYFQGLQHEWDIAAVGLFGPDGVLGEIAHVMNVNWTNYVDAETANIETWRH